MHKVKFTTVPHEKVLETIPKYFQYGGVIENAPEHEDEDVKEDEIIPESKDENVSDHEDENAPESKDENVSDHEDENMGPYVMEIRLDQDVATLSPEQTQALKNSMQVSGINSDQIKLKEGTTRATIQITFNDPIGLERTIEIVQKYQSTSNPLPVLSYYVYQLIMTNGVLSSRTVVEETMVQKKKKRKVVGAEKQECKGALDWFEMSCYMDSILMIVLVPMLPYFEEYILEGNKAYAKRVCILDNAEADADVRNQIKEAIRNLYQQIKSGKVVKCTDFRKLLEKCPVRGQQEFFTADMQDPVEFFQFLVSLFEIEGGTSVTKNFAWNGNDEAHKVLTSTATDENASPVVLRPNTNPTFPAALEEILHQVTLSGILEDPLVSGGKTYDHTAQETNYTFLPFVALAPNRQALDGGFISTSIRIPSLLNISEDTMHLQGVVCYEAGHYTSYIRCKDSWYHFNDIPVDEPKLKKVDMPIVDLLQTDDIAKRGTLYFYA